MVINGHGLFLPGQVNGCPSSVVFCSGYIMEAQPNDDNSSKLFILAQTDVKGLIPKVGVESMAR